ncbi:MAG: ABC transporter permease subunit, partial [Caldimonas sp.]
MPKIVFLGTDLVLYVIALLLLAYVWRVASNANLRATWEKVARDPVALSAAIVLMVFALVTMVDSFHFRRALPTAAGAAADAPSSYAPKTESLLDLVLSRQISTREVGYSQPLAYRAFNKESMIVGGVTGRGFPRLIFGGAQLSDPDSQWAADITTRSLIGLTAGLVVAALASLLTAFVVRPAHDGVRGALRDIAADRTHLPLRAALITFAIICALIGPLVALMGNYHVFGTDRTGNDVFYQSLKSVRTAFVIGTLATVATLPFAVVLGVLAGYLKGWVDEVIQYLYTTLSSVPNVLLIAACVLMVQVYLDQHSEMFETGSERSDVKIFLLCVILGVTGWATLCRLIRGETLKLRELDFVQAATAFGVSPARIMAR